VYYKIFLQLNGETQMESFLKYSLLAIAVVALFTSMNVLIGGASAIPGVAGSVEATVDNELRFFSVFWLAFGGFCFWVAMNIREQFKFIPFISLVFFVGGVGRLCSLLLVGQPENMLFLAMILEFILPPVIYLTYQAQSKKASHQIA
jgi:hypothetical protein